MRRSACATLMVLLLASSATAQQVGESKAEELEVPESKQTDLGLYVTSLGAYQMWKAHPDEVKILDVRTPEEYIFVGHAAMARNIPLMFVTHKWDAEREAPAMEPNRDFVTLVKQHYKESDTILVTCRSGGRSKKAVDLLAKEGFTKVYNIIDGMEGDAVKDPESVFLGKRMKNGWKNSRAPWTYQLDPDLMCLDSRE